MKKSTLVITTVVVTNYFCTLGAKELLRRQRDKMSQDLVKEYMDGFARGLEEGVTIGRRQDLLKRIVPNPN